MENTVHQTIERKIKKQPGGKLLFLSDFRGLGSNPTIRKAISRLTKEKKINRVSQGIYVVPEIDPVLGELSPSLESIAEAVAKREHVKIKPAGPFALHKLGLTTQVPMKLVYITDGVRRKIKVGRAIIKFEATTRKKLALQGEISSLIVQALEELGTENIQPEIKQKIKELMQKEDRKKLMTDIKLAPARISEYLYSLLKEQYNDRIVKSK